MKYESKFCSVVLKKHLNKKLIIPKEDGKDFENSTKVWICDLIQELYNKVFDLVKPKGFTLS